MFITSVNNDSNREKHFLSKSSFALAWCGRKISDTRQSLENFAHKIQKLFKPAQHFQAPSREGTIPSNYDYLAPDGSQIRLLPQMQNLSLAHCTLPPGSVSQAAMHRSVEEIWHFTAGQGELYRKIGEQSEVLSVSKGTSIVIPTRAIFQFRTIGNQPLEFIVATSPPWPGASEVIFANNHWPSNCNN